MANGKNIKTYVDGAWHDDDTMIMRAGDHGAWLGSSVFDGARLYDGLTPDLRAHCARVNASAEAMSMQPFVGVDEMLDIIHEGLKRYPKGTPVYIRPMYWAQDGFETFVGPDAESTRFAICLEEYPMAPPEAAATLTTTRFRRPVLEDAVINAKAGCLYPNNARMLREARAKGYVNALVTDVAGNVAESATANVFLVKDGEVFTPIPNGTFLAGITRARHLKNLTADGVKTHEAVLGFDDFRDADEVFMSGNLMKVTPVTEFDGTHYQIGPVTKRLREMYWDWAHSAGSD